MIYRTLLILLLSLSGLHASAQTVIDMHSGRVTPKTKDDYNYKAREDWQLREDSIAYNDCITRAFNYLHEDSLQQAQHLLEQALKLRPDAPGNAVVRHNIGRIFMARRQWNDAVTMLSRVIQAQPQMTEAREDRASCYYETGQYAKALKDYDYLIIQHPDNDNYRLFHALLLDASGQHLDAIDELDALITRREDYAEAYLLRAQVHLQMGNRGYARGDLDAAVKHGIPKEDIQELYGLLKEDSSKSAK